MRAEPPCILVVDDSEELREALTDLLEAEGYPVLAVGGGAQALQVLGDGLRPSLILLDQRMPGMSGAQFLEQLRSVPAYAHLTVVSMSALPSAQLAGTQDRLDKPFEMGDLLAVVSRFCPTPSRQQAG